LVGLDGYEIVVKQPFRGKLAISKSDAMVSVFEKQKRLFVLRGLGRIYSELGGYQGPNLSQRQVIHSMWTEKFQALVIGW
jgi:hypothetical protein